MGDGAKEGGGYSVGGVGRKHIGDAGVRHRLPVSYSYRIQGKEKVTEKGGTEFRSLWNFTGPPSTSLVARGGNPSLNGSLGSKRRRKGKLRFAFPKELLVAGGVQTRDAISGKSLKQIIRIKLKEGWGGGGGRFYQGIHKEFGKAYRKSYLYSCEAMGSQSPTSLWGLISGHQKATP